jgi:hypothetical protein
MPRAKTTEQFIRDAIKVHGDRYDYSNVLYVSTHTKIIIICKQHGEYKQEPASHLSKNGCPKCARNIKKTTKEFIQDAIKVHGDRYDYSNVKYVNNRTKIMIICKIHGKFEQCPDHHILRKHGCPKCGGSMKKTTEQFIQDAVKVHGDRYDYSDVKYVNDKTKVTISCRIHGSFIQIPSDHLQMKGCMKCGVQSMKDIHRKSQSKFIEDVIKIHGERYDYSKVKYINGLTKIIIICKIHGEFKQLPSNHLGGHHCSLCVGNFKKSTDEFIKDAIKVHGNIYDYSSVRYVNAKTKIEIICKRHGIFIQTPNKHLSQSQGCPICNESHLERNVRQTLTNYCYQYTSEQKYSDCKDQLLLPFDFAILNLSIPPIIYLDSPHLIETDEEQYFDFPLLIETDGIQHFGPIKFFGGNVSYQKRKKHDIIKNYYCLSTRKALLRISYLEIDQVEQHIQNAIDQITFEESPSIIFSNPGLYSKCYLPPYSRDPEINSAICIQRWWRTSKQSRRPTIPTIESIYKEIMALYQGHLSICRLMNEYVAGLD